MTKLAINTGEQFQHLSHAPIVEAVINIRARASVALEETSVRSYLEVTLEGYQFLDSQREIQHEFTMELDKPPSQLVRDLGWKGLRFQSDDKKHIVQFNRDGLVFSRLEPYPSWEQLFDEATRLWRSYMELAQPVEIDRVGLRFINRIQLPFGEMLFENYLEPAPTTPKGLELPFHGFMHQDTLAVPDHPYVINIIRTIQPSMAPESEGIALILDIDVFTTQGFEPDEVLLQQRLLEMRWLKNKAFFGSITSKALELFQ